MGAEKMSEYVCEQCVEQVFINKFSREILGIRWPEKQILQDKPTATERPRNGPSYYI